MQAMRSSSTAQPSGFGGFVMGATGINWQVARHVRAVGRIRGSAAQRSDGRMDLVGFGDDGVWVALAKGDGTFRDARRVVTDLGYNQ